MKNYVLLSILTFFLNMAGWSQPSVENSQRGYYTVSQVTQARENAEMNRHYESMKRSTPYQFQGTTQPATAQDLENTLNTVANLFGMKRKDKASPYVPVKPQQPYIPPPMPRSAQQEEIQIASDNMVLNYNQGTDKSLSFEEREAAYLRAAKANEEIINRFGYNELIRKKSYDNGTNIQLALGLLYFDYNNYDKAYVTIPYSNTNKLVADRIAYCRLVLGYNMNALEDYYRLYQEDRNYFTPLAYTYFLNNDYDGAVNVIDDYLASANVTADNLVRIAINRSALLLFQNKNVEALRTYNQISKEEIKTRAALIENLAEHLLTFVNDDLAKGGLVQPSSLLRLDFLKKLLPYDKNIFAKSYAVDKILNRKKALENEEAAWNKIKDQHAPANKTVDVYEIPKIIEEVDAQYVVGKDKAVRLEAQQKKQDILDAERAVKAKEAALEAQKANLLAAEKIQQDLLAKPFTDKSISNYLFTDWQTATAKFKWDGLETSGNNQAQRKLENNKVTYDQTDKTAQIFTMPYKIAENSDWSFSAEFTINSVTDYAGQGIILQTKGYKGLGKEVMLVMFPASSSNKLVFKYSYVPEYSYSTPWKEFVLYDFSRMANPIIMYDKTVPVTNRLTLKKTGTKIEFFINHIRAGDADIYKDAPYKNMDPTEFFNKITGIGIITNGQHSGSVNKVAFSETPAGAAPSTPEAIAAAKEELNSIDVSDFTKDILFILDRNTKPTMFIEETYKTKTVYWGVDNHPTTRSFIVDNTPTGTRQFKDACNIQLEKIMDELAQKNNWKKEVTNKEYTKKEKKAERESHNECNSIRYLRYTDDKGRQRVWYTNCDAAEDDHYKLVIYYYDGN